MPEYLYTEVPSKIDPREVLKYLNNLGYKNIDAIQLQAFIKDLKKLMKYEERKYDGTDLIEVNILRREAETDFIPEVKMPSSQSLSQTELKVPKIKTTLRRPSTEPSNLSSSREKKKPSTPFEPASNSMIVCPVHFFRGIGCPDNARSKSVGTACTCPIDAQSQVSSSCLKDSKTKKENKPGCSNKQSKIETNTTTSCVSSYDNKTSLRFCPSRKNKKANSRNCSHDFTHPCYCPGSKPRSAVIKCNIGCKPPFQKCDPVNLFKYYQRQWQINPIPGENIPREQRFRWCVREKISCGPPAKK